MANVSEVVLLTVAGHAVGRKHQFSERSVCIVGRDPECGLPLPNDEAHRQISRYHCLLDINPPDVTIRDFGSLNGTFVNGAKIGQRATGQSRDEAVKETYPERPLRHGDRVSLGETIFEVKISRNDPSAPVPAAPKQPAIAQLAQVVPTAVKPATPAPQVGPQCSICGKVRPEGQVLGDQVCATCRERPRDLLKAMLDKAHAGSADVSAIRGFTILKELGRGGMGAVFLAKKEETGEMVAMKVMLPRVAADEMSRAMFLREIEVMLALRHPNVVALCDVGCSGGVFFVTLELCDQGSVDRLMQERGGKLPITEALRIMLDALEGLHYAHTLQTTFLTADGRSIAVQGLVHRDIKPANIFLSGTSRTAKVADFGMAKAFDLAGLSGQTCTGSAAGTPVFMPRQQVLNFKYARPDVDVWAIAASFYNMATGCFPRDIVRGADPWANVLRNKPVPIRQRLPTIPKRLAEVIDAALVDQPVIGFSSCVELKRALLSAG